MSVLVLVIEDDDDIRALLVHRLAAFGFDAGAAPNGQQGLRVAAEERPDVVVLDLGLPDMEGWDVARRLPDVPLVVISASDEPAPPDVTIAGRMIKPFRSQQVEELVQSVLDRATST